MPPEIVTLQDATTGSSAEILVSQGFNCFRFTAGLGNRSVEVIYAPADFAAGRSRPSSGGIPLLFPFPGRIPGTRFMWEGKEYTLEPGDAFGNAIHGFALSRPWRVSEQNAGKVVAQFHAWRDDPPLQNRWPADFLLTASYSLAGNLLRGEFVIENPGAAPLPCGLGTHPYFRLPLGGAAADDCLIKLPVSARWELAQLLPTGRRVDLPEAAAYQAGRRFADLKLDDALSGLVFDAGWCRTSIHDPSSGHTVTQRFSDVFRECVVYTPPHRQAICIEPYTCVAGGFALAGRGIDTGIRILPPGASFSAVVEISVQ